MKKQIEELKHELGRYKKAVKTRDIVIGQLKEEIAGHNEVGKILSAYICALIEGRPENRAVVDKSVIADKLGKCFLSIYENETKDKYIIEFKEN